jgi:hypothetical protein
MTMKRVGTIFFILMFITLTACQKDIPKPENNAVEVFAVENLLAIDNRIDPFYVKSYVKGNDVFIECRVSNFSFRDSGNKRESTGKLLVFLNGKKYNEFSTAAFILKDLKGGNHRITLQIVNQNGHFTSLKRELLVNIPR